MNVIAINNYHYRRGGAESVFLDTNLLLAKNGYNVASFAMQHPANIASDWSDYFVEEIEFGQNYSLVEKIHKAPKVIYSFEAAGKLTRLIENFKPDLIHAHNIYHHLSPSVLAVAKSHQIPVLMTLHDLKLACPAYTMLGRDGRPCEKCKGGREFNVVINRCIKNSLALSSLVYLEHLVHKQLDTYNSCVDKFIVPSNFYIEKLVEWGWDRNRFVHLPNFIDTDKFAPSSNPGQYFLYFGRLAPSKGIHTIIEALAKLPIAYPLVIAGQGLAEQALKELATKLNVNVTFTGFKSGAELHTLIANAKAVILASVSYDNAPVSLLEAGAMARVIIASTIGGLPEMVEHGKTGFLFTPGDSLELSRLMQNVLDMDANRLQEMGLAGRAKVEQEFSVRKYTSSLFSLYQQYDTG